MSNEITNGQSQNPNPEVEPISSGQRANPEGDGEGTGEWWTCLCASQIELRNIFDYIRGEGPPLDPYQHHDVNQAILETVRVIFPPCGLCVNTALAYWRLIGGRCTETACTAPFVEFFLETAVACVESMVEHDARRKAEEWLRIHASRGEIKDDVERFVEQHGETWESEYPGPCNNAFEVALWMAGFDPSAFRPDETCQGSSGAKFILPLLLAGYDPDSLGHAGGDEVEAEVSRGVLWAFLRMIPLDDHRVNPRTNFARDTEEYATLFIRSVVSMVRQRQHQERNPTEDTPAEGDSGGTDPGAGQVTVVREEMPPDADEPPQGPGQTPSPPSTP